MRHVLASRRTVPLDRVDEYVAAWEALRAVADAAGVRAWLFRGTDHEDHFMEFLEWSDRDAAPMPGGDALEEARAGLDERFGHAHEDRWDEVDTGG